MAGFEPLPSRAAPVTRPIDDAHGVSRPTPTTTAARVLRIFTAVLFLSADCVRL